MVLRRGQDGSVDPVHECPLEQQRTCREVDIGPAKPEELTPPGSSRGRQHQEQMERTVKSFDEREQRGDLRR